MINGMNAGPDQCGSVGLKTATIQNISISGRLIHNNQRPILFC